MKNHNKDNQTSDRFFGNYRAIVVDDKDEFESGRIKIRVPNVHGTSEDVPDSALPWAIYSDPFMGGSVDVGGLIVPDIGSKVWVFFEEGDHDQPVYFAGAPSRPDLPEERKTGYPRTKVF